ncbi:hypothetical protein IGI04_022970 [Brassica rapa subsp. trilocularis]|uniref:Uncharacterized protein n=1 Tax=Brassica rapa subsp. trilocularis TaxID=1813537 RepID=A0ABQ7M2I2_BRACM|nr:hypothetical protein IGI04_022970 [Brassica rapa subsp. trilocularis]
MEQLHKCPPTLLLTIRWALKDEPSRRSLWPHPRDIHKKSGVDSTTFKTLLHGLAIHVSPG